MSRVYMDRIRLRSHYFLECSAIFKLFNYLKISPITPTNPALLFVHVFVRKINLKKNLTKGTRYPSLLPCAEMTQSAPVQIGNFMLLSDNTRIRIHRIQISNSTKLTCKCPRCNQGVHGSAFLTSDGIRNFLKKIRNSAEFRGIFCSKNHRNSAEFRAFLRTEFRM